MRIPELLNQLCNQSQGSNTTRRDACYGCFFRATSQTVGYPLLMAISNCADIYLNNTDYGHCQQYLRVSFTKFIHKILYRLFISIFATERYEHDEFKNECHDDILLVSRMRSSSKQGYFGE